MADLTRRILGPCCVYFRLRALCEKKRQLDLVCVLAFRGEGDRDLIEPVLPCRAACGLGQWPASVGASKRRKTRPWITLVFGLSRYTALSNACKIRTVVILGCVTSPTTPLEERSITTDPYDERFDKRDA